MWNLIKMIPKNLFMKQKQTDRFRSHTHCDQRGNPAGGGGRSGRDELEGVGLAYTHCCVQSG